MKDAVRVLAKGEEKKHQALSRDLAKKFVFLNVFCKSVKEEHDPRGPDGPYQFVDRSVPVVVVKRWDGETLMQQLGWSPSGGARRMGQILEKAMKDNGPVAPPKALRPLLKAMAKAEKALEKDRPANAIRELERIVKAGANTKKFKTGPPEVALDAAKKLAALSDAADREIDAAASEHSDPKDLKKAYRKLQTRYRGLDAAQKRLRSALHDLKGS